ncbi:MAG: hypothetical protein GY909_17205 [Oligoflexia bacterium]|nr:hypothetical protein [Oligoflexia bacterium]
MKNQALTTQKNMTPAQMRRKKMAIRKYKQAQYRRQNKIQIDQDYSKHIESAILITIVLAVLSVFYPQAGVIALIFSVLIFAAIIDTKLNIFNSKEKEKPSINEEIIKGLRIIHNEKMQPVIDLKARPSKKVSTLTYRQ